MTEGAAVAAWDLSKAFVLHHQGGVTIPVFERLSLEVQTGECVVLAGPSGSGKSTLMRMIYGNYRITAGHLCVRHAGRMTDLAGIDPRALQGLRRITMGYASQFLRVIPRVPALDLVMEPMMLQGVGEDESRQRARAMLDRLGLPERLWSLPPATFSGGEQQRLNVARILAPSYPLLLLDEPTASLDPVNRDIILDLIRDRLAAGCAVIGIFHDPDSVPALGARIFDMTRFAPNRPG
ncbi:MAG: phosphonate C-P lyase system protein PhnL [Alphaproteobacteria bacterium]